MRPNLSVNLGLRYAMQMPFYARNNSYSTASVEDVWGISGYKPGCDMSNPTSANCNLFQPGVQTGVSPPTYENLGKGVKAYNTDWNNIAPSVGVNWTPTPEGGWRRMLLGDSGESSISAGFSRAYDRRGMNDFTGVFGDNPGLTPERQSQRRQRQPDGAAPAPRRQPRTSAATCPPLPAPKPTGCLLAAPEYPLTNQNATGSVNTFDPDLQVPYSDSWTIGFQRALGKATAIEIRYVGTRSRAQWETFNYNEPNILDNGFLDEFKLAQANLQSHIAAGCGGEGNACSFAYRGPGTGTSPLPIYLAFFSGIGSAPGWRPDAVHVGELDELELHQPAVQVRLEPVHARRHELEYGPGRESDAAGELDPRGAARELLPREPRHARRRQRHRQSRVVGLQRDAAAVPAPADGRIPVRRELQLRPRHAVGALLVPRPAGPAAGHRRRRRRHARVQGNRLLRAAVRPGQALRHRRRRVDGSADRRLAGQRHDAHPERPAVRSRQRAGRSG